MLPSVCDLQDVSVLKQKVTLLDMAQNWLALKTEAAYGSKP
jgi:hypothetical protein